jgi:starvation-inducible DNA-binding protein
MKLNPYHTEKKSKNTASELAVILSNEMALYAKTLKLQWNVPDGSLNKLHALFEDHYHQLDESIDVVAEQIGELDHNTLGTMEEFSKLTSVKPSPAKDPSLEEMLNELLEDHKKIINLLRKCIHNRKRIADAPVDVFAGLMQQHETTALNISRHLN